VQFDTIIAAFEHIGASFQLVPFGTLVQALIMEVLVEYNKHTYRKGTILTPLILVWLVLVITVRRDLNYHQALNWMVAGFRWMQRRLPATSKIVKDGAISHARVKLGVEVFRALFAKVVSSFKTPVPDFYCRVTAMFDGTTGTTPDTESNVKRFGKPASRKGSAGFPQLRMVTLMAMSVRSILDVAYAPYRGKKTGERALMLTILERLHWTNLLFLLDAGLYAFEILYTIRQKGQDFIVKAPRTLKLNVLKKLPDGSFLTALTGKIEDPSRPLTKTGRKHWKTVTLTVRAIRLQIPGYRPFYLLTSILAPAVPARAIALHYHKRWEIEIAYDEIKTHQCATLRGQAPTTFRSKRADLVEQELYAMLIMYNLIRQLIVQAAEVHGKDPRLISFVDALHHLFEATPIMTAEGEDTRASTFIYLLAVIADAEIDRPRRHRINPRVVKVKMSKFKRKRSSHTSECRNIEQELIIININLQQE
jgi:hypothetical protein